MKQLKLPANFQEIILTPNESSPFLNITNKIEEKEEGEIPFKRTTDSIKYLESPWKDTLAKLFEYNFRTLFTWKDLNIQGTIHCLRAGSANITQMTILLKLTYLFSSIPIKLPCYFRELDEIITKIM